MRKLIFILTLLFAANAWNQTVVFNKFEIEPALLGKALRVNFVSNSDNEIKYVTVYFNMLNKVGDKVQDSRLLDELTMKCTGPFVKKKKNKMGFNIFTLSALPLTPKPVKMEIEFMSDDVDDETIEINEDNIKTYFPNWKLKVK